MTVQTPDDPLIQRFRSFSIISSIVAISRRRGLTGTFGSLNVEECHLSHDFTPTREPRGPRRKPQSSLELGSLGLIQGMQIAVGLVLVEHQHIVRGH